MNLRPKAFLLITVTSLLLSAALYYVAQNAIRQHTRRAENVIAHENVARVRQGLAQQLASLVQSNSAYARWDDAYQYVQDGNRGFYKGNLTESSMETIQANAVVYGRLNGELVFASGFDLAKYRKTPLPQGLRKHLQYNTPIVQNAAQGKGCKGLMSLPGGTLLISSLPVTQSDGSGPIRGFLFVGRWWDGSLKSELQRTTKLQFTVRSRDAKNAPADWQAAKASLNSPDNTKVVPLSSSNLAGFTRLDDYKGQPIALLRVDSPRPIYEQSEKNLKQLLMTIIALGLVSSVVTVFSIDYFILKRVSLLSNELDAIRGTANPTASVSVQGRDELSHLARDTNATLETLNQAHERLEERVAARTEELKTANMALHAEVVERQMLMGTLHELVTQLESARDEALRANQAKSEFLSRMSHELRTPLNAILGFSQLLESSALDEEQRESVDHVLGAGQNLLRLINEVLDFSLLDSSDFNLKSEPVELREVIAEVATQLAPLADKYKIALHYPAAETDTDAVWVNADIQRLQQILLSLISNAIKYNRPSGTVEIDYQIQWHQVRLRVCDTGPGLTAEQEERLFYPFDRLGAEHTAVSGTGVGLALAQRLAQAMNGELGYEPAPSGGSLFWIDLPSADAPATNNG